MLYYDNATYQLLSPHIPCLLNAPIALFTILHNMNLYLHVVYSLIYFSESRTMSDTYCYSNMPLMNEYHRSETAKIILFNSVKGHL